jgi:hypothetical protein
MLYETRSGLSTYIWNLRRGNLHGKERNTGEFFSITHISLGGGGMTPKIVVGDLRSLSDVYAEKKSLDSIFVLKIKVFSLFHTKMQICTAAGAHRKYSPKLHIVIFLLQNT